MYSKNPFKHGGNIIIDDDYKTIESVVASILLLNRRVGYENRQLF